MIVRGKYPFQDCISYLFKSETVSAILSEEKITAESSSKAWNLHSRVINSLGLGEPVAKSSSSLLATKLITRVSIGLKTASEGTKGLAAIPTDQRRGSLKRRFPSPLGKWVRNLDEGELNDKIKRRFSTIGTAGISSPSVRTGRLQIVKRPVRHYRTVTP